MQAVKALVARLKATPIGRAYVRYSGANGGLLAGGVSYFAFFSIFPAISLGFTIFGLVLRDQPELLARIESGIEQQLPGFVQSSSNPDGLIPLSIPSTGTLSLTAAAGVAGLLWAGLGWLGALSTGIRAILGLAGEAGNFVTSNLRDLLVLITLGLGIVVAAVVNGVTSAVALSVASWVGLQDQAWIITGAGLLVSFASNCLLVALMLRVLSAVEMPWVALRNGALFGGVAMTFLQTFGTRLVASTTSNKLFASIALVVGLLAFLNFISRAMLLAAAWAANDMDDLAAARRSISEGEQAKLAEGPPTREQAAREATSTSALAHDPAERLAQGLPTFDRRAADRVSVLSGAVLGAGVAAVAGAGLGAVRSVRSLIGRRRTTG